MDCVGSWIPVSLFHSRRPNDPRKRALPAPPKAHKGQSHQFGNISTDYCCRRDLLLRLEAMGGRGLCAAPGGQGRKDGEGRMKLIHCQFCNALAEYHEWRKPSLCCTRCWLEIQIALQRESWPPAWREV